MKKINYRYAIWIMVFLWIALIFSYSLKNAQISDGQSFFFVYILDDLLRFFDWHFALDTLNHLVRKCAHFTEYAILGALILLAYQYQPLFKPHGLHLLFLTVPFIDESIQYFVPGRSAQLSDCLLDLSGMLIGFILLAILSWLLKRGNKKTTSEK